MLYFPEMKTKPRLGEPVSDFVNSLYLPPITLRLSVAVLENAQDITAGICWLLLGNADQCIMVIFFFIVVDAFKKIEIVWSPDDRFNEQ